MLKAGDTAPDFTLPRDGGGTITLSEFKPGSTVVYFYPKDDTSGCTKEALGFTEAKSDFEALGVTVIGISKDTIAKHDKFRDKHSLGVILASDADDTVCESYGVWQEKQMYGKTYFGIVRSTFLIDGDGQIAQAWHKVRVAGHVEAVLDAAKAL